MGLGEIADKTDGDLARERLSQANRMFLGRPGRGDGYKRIGGYGGIPGLLVAQPAAEGVDQGAAFAARQGRRQDDGRAAKRRMKTQERLDFPVHIGVIGMGFVDHQDLVGEPPQPQGLMARG